MPGPYVEAAIPQNEQELKALGVAKLVELIEAEGITGYEPLTAYQEIMILAVAALLFSNTAQIAAVVLPAIFRQYGTELIKLPFNEGASATAKTTWTVVPSEGVRTIEAGTQIEAGGLGFRVEANTEVKAKATSVELQVVAVARGTEYNKVSGVAKQVNPYDWVTEVQIVGETTGGAEQETDSEYLVRLGAQLELQAPRPVNAADFAPFILGVPSSILPSGVEVGRATSIDLYDAATAEENVGNCCTTWVTGKEGEALATEQNEALETWVRKYVPFGFLAFVRSPVYETIYVTAKIHVLAGYTAASVVANVKAAVESLLSKKTWGNPEKQTTGSTAWINEKLVRYNTILGNIEAVPGVAYCFAAAEGLKIGTTATPTGTTDITLSGGPVVLPTTTGSTILVTSE
jgi:Baseplate J-like protein